jgi:hypothetical protein
LEYRLCGASRPEDAPQPLCILWKLRRGTDSLEKSAGSVQEWLPLRKFIRFEWSRELLIAFCGTVLVTLTRFHFNRQIDFCGTPDSCSYLSLGESLSQHRGFIQNFLYQYQFLSPHLPSHGIEYWRPGTSFFLLLAQPFGGVTLHSSQTVTTLAAIVLAAIAWRIAMDWSGDRAVAAASYLLCLVLPPMWVSSTSPDSALYYGIFLAGFLLCFTVRFRSYWHDAAALVCVAVVNLIRNDAILLLVPLLVVLWMRRRRAGTGTAPGASSAYALLAIVAFFAAMLPMNLIDLLVLHRAFPPSTGAAIYLNDLSDLMLYKSPLNLHTMLAPGIGKLIKLRAVAVPMIAYRIVFILLGYGAVFLPALATVRRGSTPGRNHPALPELTGSLTYLFVLIAVYGIALPAIGTFSALRSFTGLLPISAVLIVAAVRWTVVALSPPPEPERPLASLRPATLLLLSLFLFYYTSGVMQDRRTADGFSQIVDHDRRIASYLAATGATPTNGALIMTADSAAFSVTTSYPTIPIPNDNLAMMAQAAHDLSATHIVIDEDNVTAPEQEIRAILHPTALERIPRTHVFVLTLPGPSQSKTGEP